MVGGGTWTIDSRVGGLLYYLCLDWHFRLLPDEVCFCGIVASIF